MPYREAPNEAPCHPCERPAKNTCPCCTRPSCTRHFLVDKQTCAKCDEALYIFRHREDGTGVSAVPAFISMSLLPITARVPGLV